MMKFLSACSVAIAIGLLFCGQTAFAQLSPVVSGNNCDNASYDPDSGLESIQLCNDPVADGLFTEDGVSGYQYIYDVFIGSGCCGTFMIGGDLGPLGSAGTFDAQASAWWRNDGGGGGVWQVWGTLQVTDDGTTSHRVGGGFGGSGSPVSSVPGDVWTQTDGAALGNTVTDIWDTSVLLQRDFDTGAGTPLPWARNNEWHLPSEYGFSTELFAPGFNFGTLGQDAGDGLAWRSYTSDFGGGNTQLQHTFRVVSPYEPGTINWYIDRPNSGTVIGPSSTPVIIPDPCIIGDANCDGFVDIGGDILPAFTNFTGPGSFGKTRIQGDVHGPSVPTVDLDPHDGDVDVQDLLTMFGNFTGPPADGGGLAAAEAGDANIPDLIYNAATGEVTLDVDGSGIIGYVLKNGDNSFAFGSHLQVLAGVKTSVAGELSEAAFASSVGANSIGNVFPTGMNLAALTAYLTVNDVSRSLGAPVVPFDLVVLSTGPAVPEPATVLLSVFGLIDLGFVTYRKGAYRRRAA